MQARTLFDVLVWMRVHKISRPMLIAALISILISGGQATSARHSLRNAIGQIQQQNSDPSRQNPGSTEIKVIAEGFHSSIVKPFAAVVRDAETYSELRRREGSLPKLDAEFFKSNAVIAAFLGERNTGGYSVEIVRDASGAINLNEKIPGKGMLVPQMITAPFKAVSVRSGKNLPIQLNLGAPWTAAMRNYAVTKGTFTVSGGLTAIERFGLVGGVAVMQDENLITLHFTIRHAAKVERRLTDYSTGTIDKHKTINIPVMSVGSLVSPPDSGAQASGNFSKANKILSLTLTSLPSMIFGVYGGGGSIEAALVAPHSLGSN